MKTENVLTILSTKKEDGSMNSIIIIIKTEIQRSLQSMTSVQTVWTMILDIQTMTIETDQISKITIITIPSSMNMTWGLDAVINATVAVMMTTTMTSMMMTMMTLIFLLRKLEIWISQK